MSRNGNGTYTLPEPPFEPNTRISSTAMNSDMDDIADALTDSLARDGQGGMTAVLQMHADGFNYLVDPDTGMYRSAANTQRIQSGGTDIVEISAAGLEVLSGSLIADNAVRAWVKFVGLTGVISDSFGVASVSRISGGQYQITFDEAFANADYTVAISVECNGFFPSYRVQPGTQTTTQVTFAVVNLSGTPADIDFGHVICCGTV